MTTYQGKRCAQSRRLVALMVRCLWCAEVKTDNAAVVAVAAPSVQQMDFVHPVKNEVRFFMLRRRECATCVQLNGSLCCPDLPSTVMYICCPCCCCGQVDPLKTALPV